MLRAHRDGRRPNGGDETTDRFNAVSQFEMKQNVPILKDSDLDLEKHLTELHSLLDCHSYGNQVIRPIDVLNIFRRSLAPGSIRLTLVDTEMSRVRKARRLPGEAKKIYDEIIAKLGKVMREMPLERKEKAERAFEAIKIV